MEQLLNPDFSGKTLVVAPHMDDEVLACGGTLAGFPKKENIFVIFATDGTKSPVPIYPWQGRVASDLSMIRMQEAKDAMLVLGVPLKNVRFFSVEDGNLRQHFDELISLVAQSIAEIEPDCLFIPFRYDRHPDHLALNKATQMAIQLTGYKAKIYEYFVYNRYRFLPGGDIRQFIKPELLISVDISKNSYKKKKALLCYKSQTELLYDWQKRPILPRDRVDKVSNETEYFLISHLNQPGASVFAKSANWIRLIHRIEPWLKQLKEYFLALFPNKRAINVG
jgi:LmbE family N-acetylglucosaminyl deacetylase